MYVEGLKPLINADIIVETFSRQISMTDVDKAVGPQREKISFFVQMTLISICLRRARPLASV